MRRRSRARFLAPLALAAFAAALFFVVQSARTTQDDTPAPAARDARTTPKRAAARPVEPKKKAAAKRTYRVRPGDTLSRIALRTGVDVAAIEELNPGLDPQTLTVGQTIKLNP